MAAAAAAMLAEATTAMAMAMATDVSHVMKRGDCSESFFQRNSRVRRRLGTAWSRRLVTTHASAPCAVQASANTSSPSGARGSAPSRSPSAGTASARSRRTSWRCWRSTTQTPGATAAAAAAAATIAMARAHRKRPGQQCGRWWPRTRGSGRSARLWPRASRRMTSHGNRASYSTSFLRGAASAGSRP